MNKDILNLKIDTPLKLWHWFIPAVITLGGAVCNIIVKCANSSMPAPITDSQHVAMTVNTHFLFLSDIIPIGNYWFSLGDLLMFYGVFLLLVIYIIAGISILKTHKKHFNTP